jgi:hypothetical protein
LSLLYVLFLFHVKHEAAYEQFDARRQQSCQSELSEVVGMQVDASMDGEPAWLEQASDNIRQLYRYWRSKCRGTDLPRRADIDPIDIPKLLPYLTIVEVVPDDRRFVYRLVGTQEVEIRGNDPTGKSVAEAYYGPSVEDAHSFYSQAAETGRPVYDNSPFTGADGRYTDDELLFLPLSEDGTTVSRILVICRASLSPDFA